jgi:hypothetical protein
MKSFEERETAGLKLCHACNVEVRKLTDKYCRRCGARQIHDTERLSLEQADSSIAPHLDPIPETVATSLPQSTAAFVAFQNMRRRLFSLLGTEF